MFQHYVVYSDYEDEDAWLGPHQWGWCVLFDGWSPSAWVCSLSTWRNQVYWKEQGSKTFIRSDYISPLQMFSASPVTILFFFFFKWQTFPFIINQQIYLVWTEFSLRYLYCFELIFSPCCLFIQYYFMFSKFLLWSEFGLSLNCPCIRYLFPVRWFWDLMEPLRGGTWQKAIKSLGALPLVVMKVVLQRDLL
jgi:hypothetical protein